MSVETIAAGRYRVERTLGEGPMSKVLLARDGELGRPVAVKLLDERLAFDESFRARFAREARVAASLSHPNVVTVFDVGETDGVPYIVMEYVEGQTLGERLRAEGALPVPDVQRIAVQVCAGLEHAHENGLVHRDLKPGNLIERADGTVKIADFGIARALEGTELTEAGTIVGTAAYLAPEQATGGVVTAQTDLFALGAVLYELAVGQPPWKIDSLAALAGRASAPPRPLPAHVPFGLRDAIERSLAQDPADRPDSAADFARMLEEAPPTDATLVIPRTARAREARAPRRPRRSIPVLPLLLLALVLVLAALGVALLGTGGGDAETPPAETQPAAGQVQPPADGETPNEDARNLAEWLRDNS